MLQSLEKYKESNETINVTLDNSISYKLFHNPLNMEHTLIIYKNNIKDKMYSEKHLDKFIELLNESL